jgi:amidase
MAGVMEASGSFDTLGISARSVDDVALYRDVLAGVEPRPVAAVIAPLRIGFCRPYYWSRLTPSTQALLEDAGARLARAGARVEEMALPEEFRALEQAHRLISGYEMARNLAWELGYHADRISDRLRNGRLKDGLECSVETYSEMRRLCERLRARLEEIMAPHDVLVAPAGEEAPIGTDPVPHPWMYMAWTIGHVPTVTLPLFKGPNGMPVGMQVLAARYADRKLFAAARWIHEVLG